jgi:hypothetical protein
MLKNIPKVWWSATVAMIVSARIVVKGVLILCILSVARIAMTVLCFLIVATATIVLGFLIAMIVVICVVAVICAMQLACV